MFYYFCSEEGDKNQYRVETERRKKKKPERTNEQIQNKNNETN